MIHEILVIFQVVVCVALIGLILIQHGRGADVGAAFGSGASGTVFGAQGSASFLTRITAILATLFFINSMTLAYFVGQRLEKSSVMEKVQPQVPPPKPSEVPNVPSPNPSDLPPPVTAPAGQTSGTPTPVAPASGTPTPAPASGTDKPSDVPSVPSANPSDSLPATAPAGQTSSTPTAPASTDVPPPVATPPASTDVPPPPAAPVTPAPASTPAPTDTAPTPSPATPNP